VIYEQIAPLLLVQGSCASYIVDVVKVAMFLMVFRLATFSVNFEKLKIALVTILLLRVRFCYVLLLRSRV
jgi:hypothetical protein